MNKSLNTSSKIKQLSTGAPIEVVPNEIIFKDIQINQTYEITVFVRNLTQTARRIRIFQPHSNFRADYEMQGAIAAGLSMKLIVTFETAQLDTYSDSLKIVSDGNYSIDIPLYAYPPQAAIVFEPFINLGFVRVGKEKVDNIYFKNEGKASGRVELKFDKMTDFRLEPNSFTLTQGQEYAVKVYYKPREAGIFRGLVEVVAEGQSLQKTIDINATSIEFTRFLIDENGVQSNFFDFGTIYYGQSKQLETYLVNNTPKQQKFKVKLKKGLHQQEDALKLQTPAELGLEQTERIMECHPEEGTLDSYSQVNIIFKCKPKVSEEQQVWTRTFALQKDLLRPDSDEFHYSAIFDFSDNEPLMNHLQVRCICPTIKFPGVQILNFGQCAANQIKDLIFDVENKSNELPIQISWPTIPYFTVNPVTANVEPEGKQNFWVSFRPKHTGNFSTLLNAELLGGIFKIPLKVVGGSQQIQQKTVPKRGPESLPEDFEAKHQQNSQAFSEIQDVEKVKTLDFSQSIQSMPNQIGGISLDKIEELKHKSLNKEIYNEYLRLHRVQRLKKDKDKKIKVKYQLMNEKLKEIKPDPKKKTTQTDEEKPEPPIDYEFAVGMQDEGYEQELSLPEANETLFVTKPIYHYEPIIKNVIKEGKQLKPFDPDPRTVSTKKKFPFEPKTHTEIRDTTAELNAEQLQKISAGPVKIEYGNIFIKSSMTKYFYVKNDLRTSIAVRLNVDKEDFSQTYIKQQIIPSGQTAAFDITICSTHLGPIKSHIKYIINEKHIFEILVQANIEKVQLELNRQQIKLGFNEDNTEMETFETVRLQNNGNASAQFKWILSDKKIFTVNPPEGSVESGKYKECQVIYHPSSTPSHGQPSAAPQQQQSQQAVVKSEDDKLVLKVTDGPEYVVKCVGIVTEPKCMVKQQLIDFKEIVVSKQETKTLTIKNLSRSVAVFAIDVSTLPDCITIQPLKGKINQEDTRDLQVKFISKDERVLKSEIIILIRGGKQIPVNIVGAAIIPKVQIIEDEFDFGNITTLGTSAVQTMTLINNSLIPVDMVLDLRPSSENPKAPDGIDCLDIKPQDDDESILHSVHPENEDEPQAKEEDPLDDGQSDTSEPVEMEVKEYKQYNLTLNPNKQVQFNLRFSPKEVKQYSFEIPISLARYIGVLPTLQRKVLCRGLKPKFLVEPQLIEFKKKIISSPDKCFPTIDEIKLSNPDKRDVHWRIDINPLKTDKIFAIEPSEGVVGSGQQLKIRVKFNPYGPGNFQQVVSLYILSDPEIPKNQPYVDLTLTGSGAYPRLLFDKKEVILPVVPLNVMSKCTFRIINDGYENLNLKHNWAQEIGNFHLKLNFPEGQTLGIAKNKLRVEVQFCHKKPLSFTTRVEFVDDARVYSIHISGTTDNCLLTNQIFLSRMVKYDISTEERKPMMYVDEENIDSDNEKHKRNHTMSIRSSTSSKGTSALGYTPVREESLRDAGEYITRWLNYHVLTQSIQEFPKDVIESNGSQMFDLMTFLTGKSNFSYKVVIDQNMKRIQKSDLLFKQYDELVRQLKIEGALLNHIRPEYLLSYPDYLAWIKVQPKEKYEFVPENMLRLNQKKFTYLQYDAWISLFYQIIKIYYLNRINAKVFKTLAGVIPEKIQVPEYYLDGSNLISHAEGVILWFYEMCFESQHQMQSKRLKNFEQDFRDSYILSDALQTYIGGSASKFFTNLRSNCQSDDDYRHNAEKLLAALQDFGLQSHIKEIDVRRPNPREMLMILIQLFFSLPHYIPQKEPIVFQCILGEEVIKSIELKNTINKPISYWVKYEGHPDFQLEGDESVKIEPDQPPLSYKIKFTSRISQPVSGRVIFTNKKETNVQAAALVFDLKSNIVGRKSEKQWNVTSILYEIFEFNIQIQNKFPTDGEFLILINHEKKPIETKKKKKGSKEPVLTEEEFPSFFCTAEKIRIKKGQTVALQLNYIPLTMDPHKCSIIFTDPNVGEFQHDLQGSVELPNLMTELKPEKPLYVDSPLTIPYLIPFKNEQIQKARNAIQQLIQAKQRDKYMKGDKSATNLMNQKINFPGSQLEIIQFDCEVYPQTQYLSVPQQFSIIDQNKQAKKPGTENIDSKLQINYSFKNATKDFSVILTLKSKTDIRRFKLSAIVLPKIVKAQLEFRVPARQQVVQEIPIVNGSDRDWNIKVQLTPDPKGLFSCPTRDFFVKRKQTGQFPITFSPTWLQEAEAKLILTNQLTNDVFEYDLKGYGEEPVAEEHIILNCQARKLTKREIELKNPTDKPLVYQVETDVINAVGPATITVPPQKKTVYVFQVQPVLSGQYTGQITFTDEQGHYLWYTVFLNTESPKSVQTLEVSCLIRQATVIQLTLSNPLNELAIYEVLINGEGLIGEESFAIASKKDGTYDLTYAPLKVGRWRGSVAFVNQLLGEVWYEIILSADEQPIQRMNVMKASLGKVEQQVVILDNPSDQKIQVQCRITNPTNFDIYPDELLIQPYDSLKVALRYTPSSLDIIEQSDIIFTSPIGKWHYLVFGSGLPPTKFPATTVSIGLNKDYSSVIHFKNPFKEPIQATIGLDAEGHNQDVFKLLLVKSKSTEKVLVPGMNVLQVPFSFVPREITSYYCEIIIAMNEKIQWQFPVKGVTESVSTQTLFHFKAKCREKWEDEIKVGLLGIAQSLQADDRFDFELGNIPFDLQAMIQRCFQIKNTKNQLESPHDNLQYFVRFQPMKPFKTSMEFIVLRQSGGRWKYKIQLEATEPDEDDVILISSPLNKTTSVQFKLTNKTKSFARFTASFSPDSDAEFSVIPKQGDLMPYGREGTNFIISFTPVEYGKIRKGKLIIQTDDMYWSYIIKGVLPRYVPPQIKQSLIDDKLDVKKSLITIQTNTNRNYLVENIRKSKQSSPPPQKRALFPTLQDASFKK